MHAQPIRGRPGSFRKGDVVQILSEEEIRATLDPNGSREGLPFIAEMVPFCGRRCRVLGRVDRVYFDGRHFIGTLSDTVLLEGVRCDGSAHGGCQVACLLLWKSAWLKRVEGEPDAPSIIHLPMLQPPPQFNPGKVSCQATELVHAVKKMSPLAVWRYAQDWFRGERSLGRILKMMLMMAVNKTRLCLGLPLSDSIRGRLKRTPAVRLNLQPGDLVRVKSRGEIQATLDSHGCNRGLSFIPEMSGYCGKTFRVAQRVDRAVIDATCELRRFENTVALEGVTCSGDLVGGCGRRCNHLWREAWLEKDEGA